MFLPCFIFWFLCVVQVQRTDLSDHKGFHTGFITFLGNAVSFLCNTQLLCLIIEVRYEQENILIEVHLFLPDSGKHHFTITLCHTYFSATFSPVQDRYFHTYLHNLIIKQPLVSGSQITILPCITHTGKQVDAAQIAASRSHFIVRFQLATTDILCKRVPIQSLAQYKIIFHLHIRCRIRQHRIQILVFRQTEERTQLEHFRIQVTLRFRHIRLTLQSIQFQLQQVIFRNLPHLALCHCYFIEAVGIHFILVSSFQIFFCQQQIEKISDCLHRYLFRSSDKSSFCFCISHRFDTTVPFQVVHSENRLRQFQADGDGHKPFISSGS